MPTRSPPSNSWARCNINTNIGFRLVTAEAEISESTLLRSILYLQFVWAVLL